MKIKLFNPPIPIHNLIKYCSAFFLISLSLGTSAIAQTPYNQKITGTTAGKINTADCGFIGQSPHHVINLTQQVYSLHLKVEANQGKPTLLIIGPNNGDRTCILGDVSGGKLPEMGGVWSSGQYFIYVGDLNGNQYPFTLNITDR